MPQVGAHELLGTTRESITAEFATAATKRALQLALAVTIASWERTVTDDTWRDRYPTTNVFVLRTLGEWGYPLSDIEARIITEN